MQRAWLEPQGEATPFHADIAARVIPNQQRLLTAARASGIEVVHTIIQSLTADGRDRSLDHKLSSIHVAPGDPLAQPVDALAPCADEIMLPQTFRPDEHMSELQSLMRIAYAVFCLTNA